VLRKQKILFIFLDGVGLGCSDIEINPFIRAKTNFFEQLLGGKLSSGLNEIISQDLVFKHIDSTLGIKGLPQSASGQTAIVTGVNAPKIIGNHYGPYPGPSLKKILDAGNIFSDLSAKAKSINLLNIYPPAYFSQKRLRENAIVYAYKTSGNRLNELDSYLNKSISVDLTGEYLQKIMPSLPLLSPYETGKRAAEISGNYDFSFFDYWPTDLTGHRSSLSEAIELIEKLDSFLLGVYENLKDTILIITSDHGNLEDKSSKTHSLAKVPLIVAGKNAKSFAEIDNLTQIAEVIKDLLSQ